MTRRTKTVLAAVLVVVATLGFIEGAAGVVFYSVLPSAEREALEVILGETTTWTSARARFRSHPYLGYTLHPDYVSPDGRRQHSASGWFRGVDPPAKGDALRVLALGGSTTYGVGVADPAEAWPALLEKELEGRLGRDVEVLNAGVPNWTTFELLGVATMWLSEIEPDVVVLHTGFNDAFTTGYADEGGPDNTRYRHAFTYRPPPAWALTVMRLSYTARIVGRRALASGGYLVDDINAAMMQAVPQGEVLVENLQAADGKWFRRNVTTLLDLFEERGVRVLLAPVPLDDARSRDPRSGAYYLAVFEATRRNAAILDEVGAGRGVPVAHVGRGLTPAMFLDVAHVDEKGMAVKAGAIAEALVSSGLVNAPE